jgi:uncharacterized protein (TIGR03790 family)
MCARRWVAFSVATLAVHAVASVALAIDAGNVLVLYNQASPDGIDIANYYAATHPGVRLFGLTGLSTAEQISADDYLSVVRPQVLSALTSTTDVIVTTKGMPLRIQVTESVPPIVPPSSLPQYTDPSGVTRSILNWQPYSSLESELTRVDKISTWQMMGDQSYTLYQHFTANPYYKATGSFSSAQYDMRLSARLDGYNVNDVKGAIDRAQNAFVGPAHTPGGPMQFVVDNDPSRPYSQTMTKLVTDVLTPAGMPTTYDNTSAFISTAPGPVIGYDSHGVHQASTPSGYIGALNMNLADGAVFTSIESYNAYSFNVGGYTGGQGQVAQWLQAGGTAGVGNVEEPTASWSTLTNEDLLFKGLLAGKTFAESAWSANRQLSYVNTVIGDPLMTWKTLLPGDANMDGLVDIGDLSILGSHWGQSVGAGGYGWTAGDLNGDGVINSADLTLLSNSWGDVSSWAHGSVSTGGLSGAEMLALVSPLLVATPEPHSIVLVASGLVILSNRSVRRRLRQRFSRRLTQ